MSRYRKIEVKTWGDEKFRALSPMPPSGQGLWLFLMTGPHTSAIPGLFKAGRAALAEDLDWQQEAFDEAFAEVSAQGMAVADFKARLIWLPKAIHHNRPESPNVVRGWRAEMDLLPECDLKREACAALRAFLETMGPSYVEAFDELRQKPASKPPAKPSSKASAKAMANQEQEQEQEQDKNPPPAPPPGGAAAKSPRPARKCPASFEVSDALRAWAAENHPTVPIDAETAKFRDHTFANAISDWAGAWRNWIRRAAPGAIYGPSPGRPGAQAPLNRQEALEARNRAVGERWLATQQAQQQTQHQAPQEAEESTR